MQAAGVDGPGAEPNGEVVRIPLAAAALLLLPGGVAHHHDTRVFIARSHQWVLSEPAFAGSTEGHGGPARDNRDRRDARVSKRPHSTPTSPRREGANGDENTSTPRLDAEFMKTCPGVVITSTARRADYIVEFSGSRLEKGAPLRGILSHNASVAVFLPDGDAVMARSDHTLKGAMKDACRAIGTEGKK